MTQNDDEELFTLSIRKSHKKIIAVGFGLLGSLLVVVASLVHWGLAQTFDGYDKQIAALVANVDSRFVGIEGQIREIDLVVDQVDDKVSSVDSTVAVAEVKSTEVEDNVVEVREQVDEINTGLSDTTDKVESMKNILWVAFNDDPAIRPLLDDERLTELLPLNFFSDEPSKGAALPELGVSVNQDAESDDTQRDSIANRCSVIDLAATACYKMYIERYEAYKSR